VYYILVYAYTIAVEKNLNKLNSWMIHPVKKRCCLLLGVNDDDDLGISISSSPPAFPSPSSSNLLSGEDDDHDHQGIR